MTVASVLWMLANGLAPSYAAAQRATVEVIGWSKDERAFAAREYLRFEDKELPQGVRSCDGYVDHGGKPFIGQLTLRVYRFEGKGRDFWNNERVSGKVFDDLRVESFVIQSSKPCTPSAQARQNLERAKAAIAAAGVSLEAPGTPVPVKEVGRSPKTGYSPVLIVDEAADVGFTVLTFSNVLTRFPLNGGGVAAQKAFSQRVLTCGKDGPNATRVWVTGASATHEYSADMGGAVHDRLAYVNLSPSSRVAVAWERHVRVQGVLEESVRLLAAIRRGD